MNGFITLLLIAFSQLLHDEAQRPAAQVVEVEYRGITSKADGRSAAVVKTHNKADFTVISSVGWLEPGECRITQVPIVSTKQPRLPVVTWQRRALTDFENLIHRARYKTRELMSLPVGRLEPWLPLTRLSHPQNPSVAKEKPPSTTDRSSHFKQATDLMQQAFEDGKIAGGLHLIAKNGHVVHAQTVGYRDISQQRPFNRDTVVRIYSMSKPITSVGAMMLFDRGAFQLDDPVSKFIPAFKKTSVLQKQNRTTRTVTANREITVRDVFRHTTGYSYGDGDADWRQLYESQGLKYHPPHEMMPPKISIEEASQRLASLPAHHHPGEAFTYGYSTDLLGRLIEVWSGLNLDEFLEKELFEPLSMNDTGFQVTTNQLARFASCHTTEGKKLMVIDRSSTSPFTQGFPFLSGGGGLVSTADDYLKFCQMIIQKGTYNGRVILSPQAFEQIVQNQLGHLDGSFQFGLGFEIKNVEIGAGPRKRMTKQYSWGGYASTQFTILPDEKIVQVVLRQHVPMQSDLLNEMMKTAARAF